MSRKTTIIKMDQELKSKWIEGLRSGKYTQGSVYLKNDKKKTHCCLGVLCEIAALPQEDDGYGRVGFFEGGNFWYSGLPYNFREKIHISENAQNMLIDMNDTNCYSFSEIADWIEENL